MVEMASKLIDCKRTKRMQSRKVKALAVPALVAGLLTIQSPAQAAAPETKPAAVKPAAAKSTSATKSGVKAAPKKASRARIMANLNPVTQEQIDIAIAAALTKETGARYRGGAIGPNSFDCSGLVLWAYAQAGVDLPHGTHKLLPVVQRITRDELKPGDLIFSGRSGGGIQHVALYIGDNKVIHATYAAASRTNQVRIDDIDGSWVMVHKAYGRVVQ